MPFKRYKSGQYQGHAGHQVCTQHPAPPDGWSRILVETSEYLQYFCAALKPHLSTRMLPSEPSGMLINKSTLLRMIINVGGESSLPGHVCQRQR